MSDCQCCKAKDERIELLKDSVRERKEMADYWWRQTERWMEHRTGKPARLTKPRHLKLVSSK